MGDQNNGDGESTGESTELDLPDGPGGILTDSDRRYLASDEWEGDENQKRWRIRRKVQNAFWDFQLLNKLSSDEMELIFDDVYRGNREIEERIEANTIDDLDDQLPEEFPSWEYGEQYPHLLSAMEFIHRVCEVTPFLTFQKLIEQAIRHRTWRYADDPAYQRGKRVAGVSIDVNIDWEDVYDADEIERKLQRGEQLTRWEVGELYIQGRIEKGDLSANDIEEDIMRTSSSFPFPGLDPERKTFEEGWKEDMQDDLLPEMVEAVDWDDADHPSDVRAQLYEEFESPHQKLLEEGNLLEE